MFPCKSSTSIFTTLLLVVLCSSLGSTQDFVDISDEPTIFETTLLPQNEDGTLLPRYIASVGNGHVSTTVYTDTVYLNGLYNGERGESHRARIPSRNNIKVHPATDDVEMENQRFGLDVLKGAFYEKYTVAGFNVELRTLAHRYFNRVILSQITIEATPDATSSRDFVLDSTPGEPSSDITFGPEIYINTTYEFNAFRQCGQTNTLEDVNYQFENITVCVMWTEVPEVITVELGETKVIQLFASYDFEEQAVENDYIAAASYEESQESTLLELHETLWADLWSEGNIEVEGNLDLAKVVHGSLYYILSSLPVTSNLPLRQFYGLSPGGLAYGDLLMDYQGHSFWDTETWMYPSILYLHPKAAEQILSYRLAVIKAARDLANSTGFTGARYPWEGAVTGREVTPDCCPDTRELQIHITSDISFAVRQFISVTRNEDWLRNIQGNYEVNGCTMIRDMAEFYTSRASFNEEIRFHDILGVMPPDEDNRPVDNNPYTNIGAGYAIFFAKYAECLCQGAMEPVPDEWMDVATSLKLLYDATLDYHPEFEGYEIGTPIKQADVVLLGFPQLYQMNASTRQNDLLIYENVTRPDGPAMTWAMHTIGFLELNDELKAAEMFNRSYQNYMRQPYKIWTEAQPPTLGAINFITGMGGFLQSIITGYGGFRLFPEKAIFQEPRLPPGTSGLKFTGLDYLGNVVDVYTTEENFTLTLVKASEMYPLVVRQGEQVHPFQEVGLSLNFGRLQPLGNIEMYTEVPTNCDLPVDKIGTPLP